MPGAAPGSESSRAARPRRDSLPQDAWVKYVITAPKSVITNPPFFSQNRDFVQKSVSRTRTMCHADLNFSETG